MLLNKHSALEGKSSSNQAQNLWLGLYRLNVAISSIRVLVIIYYRIGRLIVLRLLNNFYTMLKIYTFKLCLGRT